MKNKKATATLYITVIFASLILVLIASVLSPIGVRFSTEMYVAGEKILNKTQPSIDEIQDDTIRNQINSVVSEAKTQTTNNIDVLTDFYQYGWVIALVLSTIIAFIFTRSVIEVQGGQGGFI